jgi:formylglycine-generating enzyme required for sulfatase activity
MNKRIIFTVVLIIFYNSLFSQKQYDKIVRTDIMIGNTKSVAMDKLSKGGYELSGGGGSRLVYKKTVNILEDLEVTIYIENNKVTKMSFYNSQSEYPALESQLEEEKGYKSTLSEGKGEWWEKYYSVSINGTPMYLRINWKRDWSNTRRAMITFMLENDKEILEIKQRREEEKRQLEQKNKPERIVEKKKSSDENDINKTVKEKFTQWMEQGEFEKATDYRQRLKDSSLTAFQKIYGDVVQDEIKKHDFEIMTYARATKSFRGELKYNPDEELFTVSFKKSYGEFFESFIYIPFNEAKKFKECWEASDNVFVLQSWCFDWSGLRPKIINRTVNGQTYTFPIHALKYYDHTVHTISLEDFEEISLAFNSLGIDNEYLQNVVLQYSDIERQIAEQERLEQERFAEQERLEQERFAEQVRLTEPEMVEVEGGTFTMGCTSEQKNDCGDYEKPAHSVTVSSFQISKYEVTQAQWKVIMGDNPSYFKGDSLPVENVSWDSVQQFIMRLNEATGKTYRLPTEAEWEYAARGGNRSKGYKYSGSNNLDEIAWFKDNSNEQTHTVGTKKANELGIHDMSGNVWEWCLDYVNRYSSSPQQDPVGMRRDASPIVREYEGDYYSDYNAIRGGCWGHSAFDCRVSFRAVAHYDRDIGQGFRVVLSAVVFPARQDF